jgi:hypothetical protein
MVTIGGYSYPNDGYEEDYRPDEPGTPCHYCADHGEYGVPATQRLPYSQWGVQIGAYVCDGCAAILRPRLNSWGSTCPADHCVRAFRNRGLRSAHAAPAPDRVPSQSTKDAGAALGGGAGAGESASPAAAEGWSGSGRSGTMDTRGLRSRHGGCLAASVSQPPGGLPIAGASIPHLAPRWSIRSVSHENWPLHGHQCTRLPPTSLTA